jgi:hypothetical protein
MVPLTDFLIGVLSALALYGVLHRFLDTPAVERPHLAETPTGHTTTHFQESHDRQRQAS